jgi:hypothetical protein
VAVRPNPLHSRLPCTGSIEYGDRTLPPTPSDRVENYGMPGPGFLHELAYFDVYGHTHRLTLRSWVVGTTELPRAVVQHLTDSRMKFATSSKTRHRRPVERHQRFFASKPIAPAQQFGPFGSDEQEEAFSVVNPVGLGAGLRPTNRRIGQVFLPSQMAELGRYPTFLGFRHPHKYTPL